MAPLLPGVDGTRIGRPRVDDRKLLNGIFFVLRTPIAADTCPRIR